MSIRVGTRVFVHKPLNTHEYPTWVRGMDSYDGKEFIVNKVSDAAGIAFLEYPPESGLSQVIKYAFNQNWLSITHDEKFEEIGSEESPELSEFLKEFMQRIMLT